MPNATILYKNYVEGSVVTATDEMPTLLSPNVITPHRQEIWRSNANGAKVTFDFGSTVTIGVIALLNHNMPAGVGYQIELSTSPAFSSLAYNGTTTVAADAEAYKQEIVVITPVSARYMRISPGASADGWNQLGRVLAGPYFQADFVYAPRWGFDDAKSEFDEARDGSEFRDLATIKRTISLPFEFDNETNFRSFVLEMGRKLGRSRDCLVYLNPGTNYRARDIFVGRPDSPLVVDGVTIGLYSWSLTVRERG